MGDDTVPDENRKLEKIFDAVDRRTAQQQILHNHISDGFMALARERYANPSSSERLGRLIYDNRKDLKSSVRLGVEEGDKEEAVVIITQLGHGTQAEDSRPVGTSTGQALRRRATAGGETTAQGRAKSSKEVKLFASGVRNQFIAVPSPEVREAIKFFRMAVDHAIEVVNATGQVDVMMPRTT